jgi:protein-S-isoprenylcysteine O-methyltransferase Ste14
LTPLPFVWPYAPAYWVPVLWAYWPEFRIVRRAQRSEGARSDRSLRVILMWMNLAFLFAFPIAWVPSLQFHTRRVEIFFGGVALVILGSLLRRHCWRMLGASFTGEVRARAGQVVVTRGAYAMLRHPSYTAGIVMHLGVGLALGSWASAGILTVATFAAYSYRVAVEERALLAAIGEPYREFMRTRKRMIPFIY